mgnify:CR=1 FL=1
MSTLVSTLVSSWLTGWKHAAKYSTGGNTGHHNMPDNVMLEDVVMTRGGSCIAAVGHRHSARYHVPSNYSFTVVSSWCATCSITSVPHSCRAKGNPSNLNMPNIAIVGDVMTRGGSYLAAVGH